MSLCCSVCGDQSLQSVFFWGVIKTFFKLLLRAADSNNAAALRPLLRLPVGFPGVGRQGGDGSHYSEDPAVARLGRDSSQRWNELPAGVRAAESLPVSCRRPNTHLF